LRNGTPLDGAGTKLARTVGVARPELIRVQMVPTIPMPDEARLRRAAIQTGLLGPHMGGLTLGYSIYIVAGHVTPRLLSHECRHVHQYEVAGSIAAFLPVYLKQIMKYGYENAPYEVDARRHERGVMACCCAGRSAPIGRDRSSAVRRRLFPGSPSAVVDRSAAYRIAALRSLVVPPFSLPMPDGKTGP
jgi:hypothetical protein